ncbi:MAG: ferredoxin family protein [Kiritimatiellae bacterium]|nr:ferredoxin family protein [Kiritimatiellia bacterium]
MKTRVIIFNLGSIDRFTADPLQVLREGGWSADVDVVEVAELAAQVLPKGRALLQGLFAEEVHYLCCASRPRTVRALLDFGNVEFRSQKVTWITVPYDAGALKKEHGKPWFPVIDRERCTGCGICHDYCLFSTYILDNSCEPASRVEVKNPLNCKAGCPACARLCRGNALIFPFCPEAALNGALDEVGRTGDDALLQAFEADPLKVLAERRRKRRLIDDKKLADAERDSFVGG